MMRRPSPTVPEDLLRPPLEYDAPRHRDNLFLWTVFLLLLVGFSMACWIGSYLVFARPELPISYKLLRKIHKIDAPQKFKVTAAPPGEFLTAEKLYNRYNGLSGPKLRDLNRQLERSYLRSYTAANEPVPYVTGRFTIMDSYELTPSDFVPSGAVALAISTDFPRVMIEHIYSSSPQDGPLIKRNLQPGMDVELRRTYELTAVLHVARLTDGHLQLTVVPINYGRYLFTGTNGGFELQPPDMLNVAAGWPIVRGDRLESANQAYLDFRTRSGQGPLAARKAEGQKLPLTALKGVDAPLEPPAPTPAAAGASPPQIARAGGPAAATAVKGAVDPKKPGSLPSPVASATPATLMAQAEIPVRAALPVNEPPRRPGATPASVLKATAPGQTGGGVSLQPFLGAPATGGPLAAAAARPVARTWPTYAPGHAPGGRNIRVGDLASLSQRGGFNGEPVYLTGQFVVRAAGDYKEQGIKRAVMRASSGDNKVRVLVDYPAEAALPAEGAEVSRDGDRPYQIMDVRQVADGTLNVYVREITDTAQ